MWFCVWRQYNPMGAGMDEAQLMREQQMYEQQMMVRNPALVFFATVRGGAGVDWGCGARQMQQQQQQMQMGMAPRQQYGY